MTERSPRVSGEERAAFVEEMIGRLPTDLERGDMWSENAELWRRWDHDRGQFDPDARGAMFGVYDDVISNRRSSAS